MPRPVPHVLIIGWTDFDLAKTTEYIDKTVFAFTFTRTWKLDIFDNYDAQNTIRAKLEKLMYLIFLLKFQTQKNRQGIIEFGSTSLQLAFEPEGKQVSQPNLVSVNTKEGQKLLYRQSYMCFGGAEAERRTEAYLISNKVKFRLFFCVQNLLFLL